jgi:predicted lipoprotein with Yx(FWY)xxD motif
MASHVGRARTRGEWCRQGEPRTGLGMQLAKGTLATLVLGAGAVGVSTLAFSGLASAKGTSSKSALIITTEHVANVGTVLATSSGRTLYRFTVDPAGKATCTGTCAKVWPPLLLPKGVTRIKAPHGVKGLSVSRVAAGRSQVFFHNQALYSFVSDAKKGEATGQGVEKEWFAVLSDGKSSAPVVASTAPSTGGAGATTTPSTSTPSASTTPTRSTSTKSTATSPPSSTAPAVTKSPPVITPPPTTPTTRPPTTTTNPPTTTTTTPPTGGAGF